MGSDVQFHATLILFFFSKTFDFIANLLDVLSAFRNWRFETVFSVRSFATYDTNSKNEFNQLVCDR